MAKKNNVEQTDVVVAEQLSSSPELNTYLNSAKNVWEKNKKILTIILGAILAIILLGAAYTYYKNKKNVAAEKASYPNEFVNTNPMFSETNIIGADTLKSLLEGGNFDEVTLPGYLKIIKNNSGTLAANRANLFAGRCYLSSATAKLTANDANAKADFVKAADYLKSFSSNGAYQLEIVKNVLQGHAASELGKNEDALSFYKKATEVNGKDEALTSFALLLAGDFSRSIGKPSDAAAFYKKIISEYPSSKMFEDAEKNYESVK